MGPDVPGIGYSLSVAGGAERLARVAAHEHVDGLDLGPVSGGEVADVGYAGVAVGEDSVGAVVGVGDPCEGAAERVLYGHVQAAVAGAQ